MGSREDQLIEYQADQGTKEGNTMESGAHAEMVAWLNKQGYKRPEELGDNGLLAAIGRLYPGGVVEFLEDQLPIPDIHAEIIENLTKE